MADFNSKDTGEQVDAQLDIVSQGGVGGGGGEGEVQKTTEAEITAMGFTKNLGTITEVKMNGVTKGTSGVVDLGTVITEHQDISGKQDKITDLDDIRSGAEKGATALQSVPSEYVTESELEEKGFLTDIPDEYVTESELEEKGYLTEHQSIEHLATKEELNSKQDVIDDLESIREGASKGKTALQSVPEEYVTEQELEGKGYLTEHQSLSHLATKSDLDEKVDKISGKQLTTEDFTSALKTKLEGLNNYDDTELSDALSTLRGDFDKLVSGDTTTAIKSFNEVIAFLDGIQDTEDLSGIIASIEQQIAGKQDVIEGLDDINEKLEVINNIVDADGYLYSNGEKVDMRFTRSLIPVGTSIPASANLNTIDYLKVGKYYCTLNVDAETVKNCPVNVAFSMEVFNPLGTNVDDETTRDYTYRLRVLTQYDTGQQYIQFCKTSGTAGSWIYNAWYVTPRVKFTLNSSKNDGTAAIGATNKGVYVDSTGEIKAMSYTVAKSVPSNAVFTDTNTKVTAVGNHYTPAEDTTQQIDAPSGEVVTGIKRDAAGHGVGVVTTPQSGGSGGGLAVETDPIFSASPAASITEDKKAEWDNKMDKVTLATVATSGSYNDLSDKPTIPSAVTESTVSGWGFTKNTGTYSKPSSGIPKTDLASAVQTSLGKADTALQSHQDISGKQDKLVSGTNIKTINGESILGSGDISISGGEGGGTSSNGRKEVIYVDVENTITSMRPNVIYWIVGLWDIIIESFEEPAYGVDTYDVFTAIIEIGQMGGITGSLTIPDYVIWANGVIPEIVNGQYELSISRISDGDYTNYFAVLTPFKAVE